MSTRTLQTWATTALLVIAGACASSPRADASGVDHAPTSSASGAQVATTTSPQQSSGDPEPAPTTSTILRPVSDTAGPVAEDGCATEPDGARIVDVTLDDRDGGLNLRAGAGTDTDVRLVLPLGTEVLPTGGCRLDDGGSAWWEVVLSPIADATGGDPITGWLSATYLMPKPVEQCPTGAGDLSTIADGSIVTGDFDGDGSTDRMLIGNGVADATGVAFVELANGGFASGPLGTDLAAEVLTVVRPVGADRDMVVFRDAFNSGASTSNYVFAELRECSITTFEGFLYGGSVGWGNVGYCLEPTVYGVRVWVWGEIGDTPEQRAANRTDSAWHYRLGDLVEVDVPSGPQRDCIEVPGDYPARRVEHTAAIDGLAGLHVTGAGELGDELARSLGALEWTLVGGFDGGDAVAGTVVYDLDDLDDDSLAAYRAQLIVRADRDDDGFIRGYTVVSADATVLCRRGVVDGGRCA